MSGSGTALGGHLARLGRPFVHPIDAGRRLLDDADLRLWPVVALLALFAVASDPRALGGAILVARVDPWGGLLLGLNALARPLLPPLVFAIAGGAAMVLAARGCGRVLPLDRAVDAAAYALGPFLALGAVGAGLHAVGIEAWALPHRRLAGLGWVMAAQLAASYGASTALVAIWAWRIGEAGR